MDVLYGISLVFSAAGRRRWLKLAGIFMTLSGLVMLSFFIWGMSIDIRTSDILSKVEFWSSVIGSMGLCFFYSEFLE
jgi:hypothetical protein